MATQEEIAAIPPSRIFPAVAVDGSAILDNNGSEITQFVLREPSGAELKRINKKVGIDADYFAIAEIAGLPQGSVERLGARVLTEAAAYLQSFMQRAQPTPMTPIID